MEKASENLKQEYASKVIGEQLEASLKNKEWLESKIKEYEELKPMLLEIGAKSEHRVMVPICNIAYFPNARIKHPNEFLVAIGDNYFV